MVDIASLEAQPNFGKAASERSSENFRIAVWVVIGLVLVGIIALFLLF